MYMAYKAYTLLEMEGENAIEEWSHYNTNAHPIYTLIQTHTILQPQSCPAHAEKMRNIFQPLNKLQRNFTDHYYCTYVARKRLLMDCETKTPHETECIFLDRYVCVCAMLETGIHTFYTRYQTLPNTPHASNNILNTHSTIKHAKYSQHQPNTQILQQRTPPSQMYLCTILFYKGNLFERHV